MGCMWSCRCFQCVLSVYLSVYLSLSCVVDVYSTIVNYVLSIIICTLRSAIIAMVLIPVMVG